MKPETDKARKPLDRDGWIEGAIDALADEGLAGMRVETLAKRLGVTKGSFYWHFKDRQDLLQAVLQTWKDGRLHDIDKQSEAMPGREREQLMQIIDVYSSSRNRKGISIELAMRDWARRDNQANETVEAVDNYRISNACKLYVAGGIAAEEAVRRSHLLYAYVFGQSLMDYERTDPQFTETKRWIATQIVGNAAEHPEEESP